jgi:pilin isopeptide linkage protein
VRLEFTGDEPTSDASFYFDLEAVTENAPLPDVTNVVVTSADAKELAGETESETGEQQGNISISALFDPITYTQTGEYLYTITMRKSNFPSNYTHDATVYNVTVKVEKLLNSDGALLAYYVVYRQGSTEKQDDILFTTKYTKPTPPAATITPAGDPDPEEPEEEEPEDEEPTAEVDPSSSDDLNSNGKPDPFGGPENAEEPMSPEKTSTTTDSPKTGDTTNDLPWVVVLCVVIVGMFICLRYLDVLRKRDEEQGNQRHHHHGA